MVHFILRILRTVSHLIQRMSMRYMIYLMPTMQMMMVKHIQICSDQEHRRRSTNSDLRLHRALIGISLRKEITMDQ